ncbi:MAG: sugar phosphate nucleotidyltransferase [Bacilli bacterium]|jgi:bifunctional UDP-N-acetylglucosamine pyrophosphorylase/glucosamine-1-phosphate N-acetyltransferase|nr:sugar phosphate nucleotidyltransferase [Bacilli bacterium]
MEMSAIILAAGKGTRMKSDHPKCAHIIIDKPMIEYVVDSLKELKVQNIIAVVGYGKERIMELLGDKVEYAVQEEQLGTAHAVKMARPLLEGKEGITIIAIGDMPFIKKETFYSMVLNHIQERADVTVLTVDHPQPYGYGRILRDDNGQVLRIIEERDCTKDQTAITEINSSVYTVNNKILFSLLDKVKNKNVQKEYYLTDIIDIACKQNLRVKAYKTTDYKELSGINNKLQLMDMEMEYQKKIIEKHLLSGVSIHNPETVVIGKDVVLESGVEIFANTEIMGESHISKNSVLGPNTHILDSTVGENAHIFFSYIENANIPNEESIGPYKVIKGN